VSLVVAQRYLNGIRLVSDTRVTDELRDSPRVRARTELLEGALKVVALHPALCVAYAGSMEVAHDALRRLPVHRTTDFSLRTVHEILSSSSRDGADFIVASLVPEPTLATILDGSVDERWERAYVGDPLGFNLFQEALSVSGGPRDSAGGVGALTQAMDDVIKAGKVPTVGGLTIEVRTEKAGFRYSGRGEISTGPIELGPGSVERPDDHTAATGAYFETYLYPEEAGVGALGVYFYQPRLGALFYPARAARSILYRDVSHPEFKSAVLHDHGFQLGGSRIDVRPGRQFVLE
jgi:hypothetical protein